MYNSECWSYSGGGVKICLLQFTRLIASYELTNIRKSVLPGCVDVKTFVRF